VQLADAALVLPGHEQHVGLAELARPEADRKRREADGAQTPRRREREEPRETRTRLEAALSELGVRAETADPALRGRGEREGEEIRVP
jgi:hypothetical protein